MNYEFFLSLAVIAAGYLFKVCRILDDQHGKSLSRIVINVTLPALILKTISTIELDFSLVLMPVYCVVFSLLTAAVAFLLFKKQANQERGIALLTCAGFNVGLFAYPLVEALFGADGLKQIAMFDFGNAFIVFGLTYLLGYNFSRLHKERKLSLKETGLLLLKSVPFMSYILAITLNLTGLVIPRPVQDILDIFARANMAMALLVLGLTLNFKFNKSHWQLILRILGTRYGCGLAAGSAMFLVLPFPVTYKTILFIALNLPVGIASIAFAVEFDYDAQIAGTVGNLTIIISFILMWCVLLIK